MRHPAKNRLKQPSAWQTPSNCRHFLDNLYQIQFSDCSALPETRLQSLTHPYSPLRASAFFRISRNPGPGKLTISQKSFGMKMRCIWVCWFFWTRDHVLRYKHLSVFTISSQVSTSPLHRSLHTCSPEDRKHWWANIWPCVFLNAGRHALYAWNINAKKHVLALALSQTC